MRLFKMLTDVVLRRRQMAENVTPADGNVDVTYPTPIRYSEPKIEHTPYGDYVVTRLYACHDLAHHAIEIGTLSSEILPGDNVGVIVDKVRETAINYVMANGSTKLVAAM